MEMIAELAGHHRRRMIELAGSADVLIVATTRADVVYCSGYRSMGYETDSTQQMAVVFDADDWVLVGPTADLWSAQECSGPGLQYYGYRTFFFDHAAALDSSGTRFKGFDTFEAALAVAIARFSAGKCYVAIDRALSPETCHALRRRDLHQVGTQFRKARAIKDAIELDLLRTATRVTEAALSLALAEARPGMTELDCAAVISAEMIRAGLHPGFVVVSSGPRSALADTHASSRRFRAGDLVRIDVGGTFQGYWSDTARTAVIGEPNDRIQAINTAIVAGQKAGLALVTPGAMTDAVFYGTVQTVRRAGIPAYERHHVGHGLGLDCHEFPTLGAANGTCLKPGMVINIEVPYYRPEWGGLMYEDTLLVTGEGAERITRCESELLILPA